MKRFEGTTQLVDFGYRRWDGNSFTWNDTILSPEAGSYKVTRENRVLANRATLEEAAKIAGVKPEELMWWKESAEQLQL